MIAVEAPPKPPPLLFGTARLGSVDPTGLFDGPARRTAQRVLDAVVEGGCRGLDLARSYQAGGTERVVGDWLAGSGMREELFLVSKAGHPVPLLAPNRLRTAPLEADLRATLRALQVDRLDLFMLHRDHPDADLAGLARFLRGIRRDGRARLTGVSNWTFERIEALDAAGDGAAVVQASSPQFSLAAWKAPPWQDCVTLAGRKHRYERRRYRRAGLPVLAYCPLGRGFFTPRGRRRRGPAAAFRTGPNLARRDRCETLARERGATPAQIALAYLASQPFPVHPVVSTSSRKHMVDNLQGVALPLSEDDRRWLETGGDQR
mgnify:CR=1 FL=1